VGVLQHQPHSAATVPHSATHGAFWALKETYFQINMCYPHTVNKATALRDQQYRVGTT